jgi:hypothetical protein
MASRLEVVQDASNRVGDLELGKLTGVTNASHLTDSSRTEPDGHWTDAWLSIKGVERRVTSYLNPGVFTTNSFPTLPAVGDDYELRKDQLHTRQQMVSFANAATRDVQFTTWVLLDSYLDALDIPTVVDETTAYPVPPEMECVYGVLYQLPQTQNDPNWYPVSHNDWFINEPEMVTFYEHIVPVGSRVRFLGTRRPVEMLTEEAVCEVEPSFVSVFAAKLMSLRMLKGSDADRMKTVYAGLREEEQAIRRTMRLRQPNNIRRVRPTGTGAIYGTTVPVTQARASHWFTGDGPPTYQTGGRPGDFYLQGSNGTVWEFMLPGGWTPTTTDLTGPSTEIDMAHIEYDLPGDPLDIVPAPEL